MGQSSTRRQFVPGGQGDSMRHPGTTPLHGNRSAEELPDQSANQVSSRPVDCDGGWFRVSQQIFVWFLQLVPLSTTQIQQLHQQKSAMWSESHAA